jgi:putative NADH-flavin reductase
VKIVVIGATGDIGRRVAKEALSRGHQGIGVVRDRDEAREGREALAVWRNEAEGLDWTYLSPAA